MILSIINNYLLLLLIIISPYLVGGLNPSEKYESQLGWWNSQYMEKIKVMFQTTNQVYNHLIIIW